MSLDIRHPNPKIAEILTAVERYTDATVRCHKADRTTYTAADTVRVRAGDHLEQLLQQAIP